MLLLNKVQMEELISIKDAITIIEDSLLAYSKKETIAPLRAHIPVGENSTSLFMPAYIPSMNSLGIKIVSVFPENAHINKDVVLGKMLLLDDKTGEIICIMDGTFLTKVRTGAVGAVGLKYLSRENSETLGIIGAGGQAEHQILGALATRKIKTVKIFDFNFAHCEDLATKLSKSYSDVKFIPTHTSKECVESSDIIITVTTSKTPVFSLEDTVKGCHINGIGSYTKSMNEIPKAVLDKAQYISVDTKDAVTESGDLDGVTTAIEISDIIANNTTITRDENAITFYKSTGSSIFDVSVARYIYEQAISKNIGTKIDF